MLLVVVIVIVGDSKAPEKHNNAPKSTEKQQNNTILHPIDAPVKMRPWETVQNFIEDVREPSNLKKGRKKQIMRGNKKCITLTVLCAKGWKVRG